MKETFFVPANSDVTVEVPDQFIKKTIVPISVPTNLRPIPRAGADQTLVIPSIANSINTTLNGSGSTDPEGKPLTYAWRKVSGPIEGTISSRTSAITSVNNLVVGSYVFELRVVDVGGLVAADTMTIVVTKEIVDPINIPPVAKAGNDQTITLPNNKINLDGSLSIDPDGQIKSYKWAKVSGPNAILDGTDTAILRVSDLTEGQFVFRLTITDNNDSTNSDEVTITVKSEIIVPPTGATYPFTLTQNKTLTKLRHFGGFENWNGQNYASFTGGWKDYYFRFCFTDFIKGTNGAVDWSRIDNEFRKAITQGAGISIGFMLVCDSDDFLARESYGGATSRYCQKWHNDMQAEGVKDFTRNGMWIPNWNSVSLWNNVQNAYKLLTDHIENTSFNGVKYKDAMNYVDVRMYAQWGEWHNGGLFDNVSQFPAGTRPTVATYKKMIDLHCDAFPNYPLVILFAAYDANWLPHTMTPPEVTEYALTKRNGWGLIGWRRDQWGNDDNYVHDYLERNSRSFGSSGPFSQIIMERWKYAPIVGEPYGPGADLSKLKDQVIFYHATSVGNGNYPNNSTSQNLFKGAVEEAGAKLSLNKGQLKVSTEFDFDITLTAENFGNSPIYNDRLNIVYELRNASGVVVWTSTSLWKPLLKIKGIYNISDHYKVTTVAAGIYSLVGVIKDNYRALPLYNDKQNTDGTIVLATGIKF